MASSGLIVAFVVALWATYFVPLVLRRYDEANKNSALDTEGPMRRVVTSNQIDTSSPAAESAADPRPQVAPRRPAPTVTREAARIAARRRRNTLLTLVALLAVVGGVAGFGYLPLWAIAVPAALIVGWLILCRVMVRAERGIAHARAPRVREERPAAPDTAEPREPRAGRLAGLKGKIGSLRSRVTSSSAPEYSADDEETIIVNVDDIDPDRKHVMEDVPLTEDALDEQLEIAVPSVGVDGQMLWDPLPVTVPTYVTKPRAGRTVRTIDFTQAGAWTSGHVEGENVDFPTRSDEQDHPQTRRAVGH
ncbi:hypothetical protein BHE97_18775 [Aeromicrobium sp. PE09-221]|uniref:divisome protein SepX/GlpR n=1 Tax=Aeromicrobium sp. PE09-221 TaxID=1898043 RepID=UPI000B3E5C09|nr:hypothetical protein [Aeromicrobium sp. PE09-221]OUZ06593.1 hypothetical protein BHE97_18775 [Aeromicrobium sp. PE09-221]